MSYSHAGPGLKADRNLSDLYDAVSAWNNLKQTATETVSGVVELATAAEVTAGTAGALAVTPSSLMRGQANGVAGLDGSAKLSISIFPGTPTGGTFLRGDGTWVVLPGGGNMLTSTYDPDADGVFAVAQGGTGATTASAARTNLGLGTAATQASTAFASSGAITGSGLTLATSRLVGRTSAGTGAPQEITVGSGLTFASSTLSVSYVADSIKKTITQTSHGFVAGDVLKFASGVWAKAQADSAANSEAEGVVESSVDVNNFVVVLSGYCTLSGLTQNTEYYISPSTAGLLTGTVPTTAGQIIRRIGKAISTTVLIVNIQQPGVQVV